MRDDDIQVEIATPKGVYSGEFDKNTKIQDVIQAVVAAMGLSTADQYELVFNGKVLKPIERPLVSFHLPRLAQLELVATGSGV